MCNQEAVESCAEIQTVETESVMSEASTVLDEAEEEDYGLKRVVNHAAFMDLRPSHEDVPKGFVTWRHKVSGVQHLRIENEAKFQCGRRVTDRYTETDEPPLVELAICQTCLKAKTVHLANARKEAEIAASCGYARCAALRAAGPAGASSSTRATAVAKDVLRLGGNGMLSMRSHFIAMSCHCDICGHHACCCEFETCTLNAVHIGVMCHVSTQAACSCDCTASL